MAGIASRPTTVSVAPMIPLVAANTTHMRTVPIATPPGMRRVHMWMASNRRSAMPDCSNIEPMKMNSGTAASTLALATSSSFWMSWYWRAVPNVGHPKSSARASIAKATGKPVRMAAMSAGNIHRAVMASFRPLGGFGLLWCERSPRERERRLHDLGDDLQRQGDNAKEQNQPKRPYDRVPSGLARPLGRREGAI